MAKPDAVTRAVLDVRKAAIGQSSSGSPLMSPVTPSTPGPGNTKSFTWILGVGNLAVGGVHGPCVFGPMTMVRVDAGAVGGTCTFNIEIRDAYDTPGTDLMGSELVADSSAETVTSFAEQNLKPGQWFYLDVSAVDPGTTELSVTVNAK